MKWTPFTLHVRVTPQATSNAGARTSYLKSLQKFGLDLYDGLISNTSFNIAIPGGGQIKDANQYVNGKYYNGSSLVTSTYSKHSGFTGTAVKPQIGDYPAQLMITGFYQSSSAALDNYPSHQVISAGTVYTGYNSAQTVVPTSTVSNEVKALKSAVDTLIANYLPAYANAKIHRLEYSGIVYGDRGISFPR